MTLGFTQYFDKEKQLPTFFKEKIHACVSKSVSEILIRTHEVGVTKISKTHRPKIHTMRGFGKKFRPGMKIHMVYGDRTKDRRQFNVDMRGIDTCISTQVVVIRYRRIAGIRRNEGIDNFKFTRMVKRQFLQVYVDGNLIGAKTLADMAVNDGFDNITHFLKWFRRSGKYQLIHWTNFKY